MRKTRMLCLLFALFLLGCSPRLNPDEVSAAASATLTAIPTATPGPTPACQVTGPQSGAFQVICPAEWEMYKDIGYEISFFTDDGSVIITAMPSRWDTDPGSDSENRLLWWVNGEMSADDALIYATRRPCREGEILSAAVATKDLLFGDDEIYHSAWFDVGNGGIFASEMYTSDSLSPERRELFLDIISSITIDAEKLEAVYY